MTRQIDTNGDWTFGQSKANYLSKSDEIKQNIVTRLKEYQNDWVFDIKAGIDWFTILGQKSNEKTIRDEVSRIVLATAGVKSLDKIEITTENRQATIKVSCSDVYNENFRVEIGV